VRRIIKLPSLQILGLHSHIGSQIFDALGFEVAAQRIVSLAKTLCDELDVEVTQLNLGGGMGIAYLPDDDPLDIPDMAMQIGDIVAQECANAGIAIPSLAFEPGRAIVGPAGITIYEVGTVKDVELEDGGSRCYVSVDGGMSDNIRTALYDAQYTVALASRKSSAPSRMSRVVGKHCESGDIVVRDAMLPADLAASDLLAVAATGAYCRSMASNYNYLPKPAVVSVREGRSTVVLRRESMEDLLRLDPGTG
jgi:diaminopimelate decarboxylase